MSDCKGKSTPTDGSGKPLGSDKEGAPASASWSYPSVIGMLLYLASNSRPDIAYATHMAARYTHSPKASPEAAVVRICRYLQHTKSDGLILRPTKKLELTLYTDADFAGHYGTSTEDPATRPNHSQISGRLYHHVCGMPYCIRVKTDE